MMGLALKPILEALTTVNVLFLTTHHVPPLYRAGVRYQNEPREWTNEHFDTVPVILKRGWGDCFPVGTLILNETRDLIPIESLEVGDRIWGENDWSTVEAVEDKGPLDVDAVFLNNGSCLKLTSDHHVYVLECPEHGVEKRCSCTPKSRRVQRVRVSELEAGMVLMTTERVPFGADNSDPDRHYVEGLFAADGWSDKPSRFCISGKDGSPKEEQKEEVRRICNRLGIATRHHERYIAVNNRDWALRMQLMGHRAPEKRVLSLDLGEVQAAALLRGVMADSGANTSSGRTLTSTSPLLATQVRVLQKMFGRTCGYSYVPDHGGLGKNPVHRLNVRERLGSVQEKILRVRSIERRVTKLPCVDIQTNDHRVYLPEHDVTVSQCDDLAPWRCAELRHQGERARIRIQWKRFPNGKLFHIVVRRENGEIEDPSAILGMGQGR